MRILLINPDCSRDAGRDLFTGDILTSLVCMAPHRRVYSGFPLALPTLAAVTPDRHSVKIVDEAIEPIHFDEDCDLVGVTAMTFKATRAYQIAGEFRKRGKTVVLGGIHASMCPQEAALHADCVVGGEAEEIWPVLLDDFENGSLKKFYKAERPPDITRLPVPRYSLVKMRNYYFVYLQTSRGCPYNCEFCTVTQMNGRQMRFKSPGQVVAEIEAVLKILPYPATNVKDRRDGKIKKYHTSFFFTDDNFAINREHAVAVCRELIRYQRESGRIFTWVTQVNYKTGLDDELLEIFSDANCDALFMGFESLDPDALRAMNKTMNSPQLYARVIENVRRHGMECVFSMILGGDYDTPGTVDTAVDFINKNQVFYVLPNILTPYPGTHLYEKLQEEGRIIDREPSHYNIRNTVFIPKKMSPFELQRGYVDLCNRIFRLKALEERSRDMLRHAHQRYNFILPFGARVLAYVSFLYSALALCFQGRLSPCVFAAVFRMLSKDLLRYGTLLDFFYPAWILDYDAFARSETRRLTAVRQACLP